MQRSATRAAIGLAMLVWILAVSGQALAVSVYLSPDSTCAVQNVPTTLPVASDARFEVCIDGGSEASSAPPCTPQGEGDDICALDISLIGQGAIEFVDFLPVMSTGRDVVAKLDEQLLKANALPSPPLLGPFSIGQLIVANTDPGGSIEAMGLTVGAGLRSEPIPNQVIAVSPVPEPGELLMLVSGLLGLAALHAHRSRGGRR